MVSLINEAEYKSKPLAGLLADLETSPNGLTTREATVRLKQFGFNEPAKKTKLPLILKFLSNFRDPLVLILIVAALVSGLTGEIQGMTIIITIVFFSVIMNFYQEYRSSLAAEKIAAKLTTRATITRDGKKLELLTKEIVPGDICSLSAGDIIPADGRLISADDFFVNEASLTGESFPVEKSGEAILLSGTNVVSGYAAFLVIKTGGQTEFGKIAGQLERPETTNAFELGIRRFGYLIIRVIIAIVLAVFAINTLNGKGIIDSLIFSLAIAVGLTPELLPMIMSVNLARGSIAMAKKGVIVKRLNSIPAFGSMDILCTDKTGTLTEDKITLVRHYDLKGVESERVLRLAYFNGAFETGIKSALDRAILEYRPFDISKAAKVDEIPYDFARRRSSIIYREGKERLMVTKGGPEEVFKICKPFDHAQATKLYDQLSSEGFRVLAIASRPLPEDNRVSYHKEDEHDLFLEGFVAFFDPPKKSAGKTLAHMRQHGIEVKILSGDSPLVTKKVCQELAIEIKGIVTGEELDLSTMSDELIWQKAKDANIFARLSPFQKEKVIAVLRQHGAVVGYLGDGINDTPSLKTADIGISVENAVDVAKETADIILMKKGLKELMDGVIEGRKIFGNTMKYLMMGLSSNFGNMFSMIGAALFLPFFPMLPGQILVNNLLYDVSQLAIPLDRVDQDYMKKPKHWDIGFIRNFMLVFGPISSIFDFLTFYILLSVFGLRDTAFQTGWFIESLATQTFVIYIIRTRLLPFVQSRPAGQLVFSTLGAVSLGLLLTYLPINTLLGFTPLQLPVLLVIAALVIAYLFIMELVKNIFYRFADKAN